MNVGVPGEGSSEAFWAIIAAMVATLFGLLGFFRWPRLAVGLIADTRPAGAVVERRVDGARALVRTAPPSSARSPAGAVTLAALGVPIADRLVRRAAAGDARAARRRARTSCAATPASARRSARAPTAPGSSPAPAARRSLYAAGVARTCGLGDARRGRRVRRTRVGGGRLGRAARAAGGGVRRRLALDRRRGAGARRRGLRRLQRDARRRSGAGGRRSSAGRRCPRPKPPRTPRRTCCAAWSSGLRAAGGRCADSPRGSTRASPRWRSRTWALSATRRRWGAPGDAGRRGRRSSRRGTRRSRTGCSRSRRSRSTTRAAPLACPRAPRRGLGGSPGRARASALVTGAGGGTGRGVLLPRPGGRARAGDLAARRGRRAGRADRRGAPRGGRGLRAASLRMGRRGERTGHTRLAGARRRLRAAAAAALAARRPAAGARAVAAFARPRCSARSSRCRTPTAPATAFARGSSPPAAPSCCRATGARPAERGRSPGSRASCARDRSTARGEPTPPTATGSPTACWATARGRGPGRALVRAHALALLRRRPGAVERALWLAGADRAGRGAGRARPRVARGRAALAVSSRAAWSPRRTA